MTAAELMASIRLMGNAPHPQTFFLYIAAHAEELRLRDGSRLLDLTDFKIFLSELADAAEEQNGKVLPMQHGTFVIKDFCPRCGHAHEGAQECGVEIGGGRICRCEMEVPA